VRASSSEKSSQIAALICACVHVAKIASTQLLGTRPSGETISGRLLEFRMLLFGAQWIQTVTLIAEQGARIPTLAHFNR